MSLLTLHLLSIVLWLKGENGDHKVPTFKKTVQNKAKSQKMFLKAEKDCCIGWKWEINVKLR